MKIMTVLGTRPEIIRLSRVIPLLDRHAKNVLVHTGQNYEKSLSDIFFQELGVRAPDYSLKCQSENVTEQIGKIMVETEKVMRKERPDRLLVLGDTNSGLSAYVAARLGIPVYHMEAGNRCYDDRVPEEINRRVIDHCSNVLMPYTERSRANLLREGIAGNRIFVTGNPINEVLAHYDSSIEKNGVLDDLNLEKGKYFVATLHRAENVDIEPRLTSFIKSFNKVCEKYKMPLIWSVHPRTKSKLKKETKFDGNGVRIVPPLGLFEFIKLERNAACVLTDSGTVQEECCIFKVPNVTLRDTTERPETIEVGSNILSGAETESVLRCVDIVMNRPNEWTPPREYLVKDVSSTVQKIVLGYQ
jgi:UDP-N-acetylglucosamine 2-epimerase (non-hydrolysing)